MSVVGRQVCWGKFVGAEFDRTDWRAVPRALPAVAASSIGTGSRLRVTLGWSRRWGPIDVELGADRYFTILVGVHALCIGHRPRESWARVKVDGQLGRRGPRERPGTADIARAADRATLRPTRRAGTGTPPRATAATAGRAVDRVRARSLRHRSHAARSDRPSGRPATLIDPHNGGTCPSLSRMSAKQSARDPD